MPSFFVRSSFCFFLYVPWAYIHSVSESLPSRITHFSIFHEVFLYDKCIVSLLLHKCTSLLAWVSKISRIIKTSQLKFYIRVWNSEMPSRIRRLFLGQSYPKFVAPHEPSYVGERAPLRSSILRVSLFSSLFSFMRNEKWVISLISTLT